MTATKDEQYRAGFEAWAVGPDGPWTPRALKNRIGAGYGNPDLQIQWDCWTASKREASTEPSGESCTLCGGAGGEYGSNGKWWLKCSHCDGSKIEPAGALPDKANGAALVEAKREGWREGMVEAQELLADEVKDSARLCWLEDSHAQAYRFESTGTWRISDVFAPIAQAGTLREAIDAAIEAQAKEQKP